MLIAAVRAIGLSTLLSAKLKGRATLATEAYGVNFWIGKILRSKDTRELWRHVVINEIRGGHAKCHNILLNESGNGLSQWRRGSWISLKLLAKRWEHCKVADCFCKERKTDAN
jgi:hypothetical protein